jgi:hypothetical protein
MVSWEMSPFDSFDEGEGDFDSVVKDDGVSDVDDDFDGEPEEEQQAPSIISEVFTIEVIEVSEPAPESVPLPDRAQAAKPVRKRAASASKPKSKPAPQPAKSVKKAAAPAPAEASKETGKEGCKESRGQNLCTSSCPQGR